MKFDPWSVRDNAVQYVNAKKKTRIGLLFFSWHTKTTHENEENIPRIIYKMKKIIDIKDASCLEFSSGSFLGHMIWCHGCCNPQVDGPSDEDDAGRKKPCWMFEAS